MAIINDNFKMDYIPARICDGKELCIKYYAWDQKEGKRKRKVMRFNHLIGKFPKREIYRMMNKAVFDINVKLESGKNPYIESELPKAYSKLSDAVNIFSEIKEQDMREDGFRSYKSFIKKLNDWLILHNLTNCYVIDFNKDMAVDFLIEIERNKSIGNRTYNNYVEFYRGLWNWLIEKNYCKNNIFTNFKKKEEEEKIRQIIDPKSHLKIIDYCRNNMPNMEIVIDLVRSSFIRPAEICRIKISNIDLFNKVISIPQGNSKTKKFRFAYLPDWLVYKIINNMSLENYPLDFYLLTRNLKPGTKKIGTRELDKYWAKIRTDLNLGMELQLYSYRDTGITALEDAGIQRRVIIKLTGHQSEEMAGKYIRQPSRELIDNIVTKIKE